MHNSLKNFIENYLYIHSLTTLLFTLLLICIMQKCTTIIRYIRAHIIVMTKRIKKNWSSITNIIIIENNFILQMYTLIGLNVDERIYFKQIFFKFKIKLELFLKILFSEYKFHYSRVFSSLFLLQMVFGRIKNYLNHFASINNPIYWTC